MPTIIHFDISADDIERAIHFYEELFAWKFSKFPGPQAYFLIETEDASGGKGISGGLAKRDQEYQKITNFVQVESIDDSLAKVVKLGGAVIEEKTTIPTVGFIAGCMDTEDNIFGLIELEKSN